MTVYEELNVLSLLSLLLVGCDDLEDLRRSILEYRQDVLDGNRE